ncbi:MAG: DUF4412 domain-containing protein [Acidobacteriota bacterium]|nr:DUF4412 domain-containing protein [Acidobacteriota bacterium]
MKTLSALVLSATLLAVPAAAQVTIIQKTSGKAMGRDMSGDATIYIKGTKMRTDQTMGGKKMSVIIDAGTQQMTMIDHDKREATVTDMRKITQDLAKIEAADVKATMSATGERRTVAGQSCAVHNMDVRVPAKVGQSGDDLIVVMKGPVCLAKGGPGAADYLAFYKAAAEKGLFFTDPRAAKAQPGQARGMTELYRQMADKGVAYATELEFRFEGSGMMAGMMNKVGAMTMKSEVVSASGSPIDDSVFAVPAGFKTKTQ